jgi:TPR repeat protein
LKVTIHGCNSLPGDSTRDERPFAAHRDAAAVRARRAQVIWTDFEEIESIAADSKLTTADAMYLIGEYYVQGTCGFNHNYDKGAALIRQAAAAGSAQGRVHFSDVGRCPT